MNKPAIVDVVARYTELKRVGREWVGLSPFRTEKTPSFHVNEEKETFYDFGDGEGGDVIRFIELIEGLDFKGALAHLGLNDQHRPTRGEISKRELIRQASKNLTAWVLNMSESIGARMREIGNRTHIAQKILKELAGADVAHLQEVIQRGEREREILSALDRDMVDPEQIATMWEDRESIEQLVGDCGTYTNEEIEDVFPPITDAYRQRLTRFVRGEA